MLRKPRIYAAPECNLGLSWPALLLQLGVVAARHLRWCICPVGRATGRSPGEPCWLCWPAPPARHWARSSRAAPPPPLRPSFSCFCHYAPLSERRKAGTFRHIPSAKKKPFFSPHNAYKEVSESASKTPPSTPPTFFFVNLWLRFVKTSSGAHALCISLSRTRLSPRWKLSSRRDCS